jgi:CHAD domain-containing protein
MDGLHDLRVETRRQLVMVALGEEMGAAHSNETRCLLKRCLRETARLRDTEVLLSIVDKLMPEYPELRNFRRRLERQKRRDTETTQRRLNRRKRKFSRRVGALAAAMDSVSKRQRPLTVIARRLKKAADEVRELSLAAHRGEAKLHRARVAVKRLRYTVEALGSVLPGARKAWLNALRRAQHSMGEINDLEVLVERLRNYTACRPRERRRLREATALIVGRQRRRRHTIDLRSPPMPATLQRMLKREVGGPPIDAPQSATPAGLGHRLGSRL